MKIIVIACCLVSICLGLAAGPEKPKKVVLVSIPAGAQVVYNLKGMGNAPVVLEEREGKKNVVYLSMKGYRPQTFNVTFNSDTLKIQLDKEP